MSLDAVTTYRYLRVALVGAVAMLFTGLAVQAVQGEEPLGSISALY